MIETNLRARLLYRHEVWCFCYPRRIAVAVRPSNKFAGRRNFVRHTLQSFYSVQQARPQSSQCSSEAHARRRQCAISQCSTKSHMSDRKSRRSLVLGSGDCLTRTESARDLMLLKRRRWLLLFAESPRLSPRFGLVIATGSERLNVVWLGLSQTFGYITGASAA